MNDKPIHLPKKIYVLDTNILVHDPSAIFSFAGAYVGLPSIVLEELDRFKSEPTDRGRNTRQVIRYLDELRSRGSLKDGVFLDNGGMLKVIFLPIEHLPKIPFAIDIKDNAILLTTLYLKEEGFDVRFITNDINARVKADSLGIYAEDYRKEYVTQEEFYQGWIRVQVPAVQLKSDQPAILQELLERDVLAINQFVLVESQHNPYNYRVFRYLGGKQFLQAVEPRLSWPLQARNPQQLMAINLLFDENIKLITLFGPAGTGKTFLALFIGLYEVLIQDRYSKMLITRPVVPLGRDIGYLPGELHEKLHSWMLPIYDNMDYILHSVAMDSHLEAVEEEQRGKKGKHKKKKKPVPGLLPLTELMKQDKVSLEAITYMRGRSIPYQFILIDEAQNLTAHEVKTLVTRAGEGSKIILAGDPYQIDSPYLDFGSNGLVRTSERFKGFDLFGSVYLSTSERSELSKLAGEIL